MVAVCGVLLAGAAFPGALRRGARVIARAAAGMALAFVINYAAAPFGWNIGINPATAAFVGFLGAPGLAALYICKAMLL
jgi:pro-sigmaK processing inhibitor BofA